MGPGMVHLAMNFMSPAFDMSAMKLCQMPQ